MFWKFSSWHRSTFIFPTSWNLADRKSAKWWVAYLTKTKQNFAWLPSCRYRAYRAQNLPGPAPNNVLSMLKISSKSVHFRRNYSRTREHSFFAPWIKSSIRPNRTSRRINIFYLQIQRTEANYHIYISGLACCIYCFAAIILTPETGVWVHARQIHGGRCHVIYDVIEDAAAECGDSVGRACDLRVSGDAGEIRADFADTALARTSSAGPHNRL